MADKHPYSPGGQGGIAAAINQLRKSFPKTVDADTLRKLSIAPKNESYVINVLRFVGVLDATGNKTEDGSAVFSQGDEEFKVGLEKMVKKAYTGLFDLYQEGAWALSQDKLMSYFRSTDQTSELVGRHQANTFQLLASFAGHGQPVSSTAPKNSPKVKTPKPPKIKTTGEVPPIKSHGLGDSQQHQGDFALTVRIEVNLPAQGDQDTYDKIFRSIRENLFPNAK